MVVMEGRGRGSGGLGVGFHGGTVYVNSHSNAFSIIFLSNIFGLC